MRVLLLLTVAAAAAAPVDLDVNIPPGTPLEWNRELSRPLPTGHRGQVPSRDGKAPQGPPPGGTQAKERRADEPWRGARPDLDFVILNAQDFFQFTTSDYNNHLKWPAPPPTKPDVTQDDVATDGGFVMAWNYPPNHPSELIWVGLSAVLREKIHSTAISWTESAAHCLEVGEPTVAGLEGTDGRIQEFLASTLGKLPPRPPIPPRPADKDPKQVVLYRLAAVELTGGFPHAMDPTFARRTLALGLESWNAVRACAASEHTFLARNAVAVLATFQRPETGPELARIWKESRDPVVRARALRGLSERGEKSVLDDLIDHAMTTDGPYQAMAIHALSRIGDPKAEEPLLKLIRKDSSKPPDPSNVDLRNMDLLRVVVPALGRLRKGKETLIQIRDELNRKLPAGDLTSQDDPVPQRLLRHMTVVALAMHGEARAREEVEARVAAHGLLSFQKSTWYQLIDALALTEPGAELLRKTVLANPKMEKLVRLEALKALHREQRMKAPALRELAMKVDEPAQLRARAIQLLAEVDAAETRDVCAKLLIGFGKSETPIDAAGAFLIATAAQAGGALDAFEPSTLIRALERAFGAGVFARREGNNSTKLNMAKIAAVPPLMETLAVELGRTGSALGVELLSSIVNRRRFPQGRAEAVLALANIGGKEADTILVESLDDKDGWVRYCAWKGLVKRSGRDHFCDWIFGDPGHRKSSTAAYKAWLKEAYPK